MAAAVAKRRSRRELTLRSRHSSNTAKKNGKN